MRRTITTIISFIVWLLLVGISVDAMQASIFLGIFAFFAFTIVILFGWVMISDLMADLDEEEAREKKRRKEKYKVFQYDDPEISQWDTSRQPIKVVIKLPTSEEGRKKKKKFPNFRELLSKITPTKKEKSTNLENGPVSQKEYRGRNINKQTLD